MTSKSAVFKSDVEISGNSVFKSDVEISGNSILEFSGTSSKLGINMTPSNTLDVSGDVGLIGSLTIDQRSDDSGLIINRSGADVDITSSSSSNNLVLSVGNTSKHMIFETGGSERVRIDDVGNVGIGKTPSSEYSLEVDGSVNIVNNLDVSGGVNVHNNLVLGGDLTVNGNDINMGNGATIVNTTGDRLVVTEAVVELAGDVSINSNLDIVGDINSVVNIDGTGDLTMNTITMTGFNVNSSGDTEVLDLTVTGNDITMGNGATIVNTTGDRLVVTEAVVELAGDVSINSNLDIVGDINSVVNIDGTGDLTMNTITMTGFNVNSSGDTEVLDLTVTGNDITMGNGATIVNTDASTLTVTEENVVLSGDLTINGNDITMGNGATIVNTDASTLTVTEENVVLSGDLTVNGNNIIFSNSVSVDNETTGEFDISANETNLSGNIKVDGNNIKSSTGANAIVLNTSNVKIGGNLEVSGNNISMTNGAIIDNENELILTIEESTIELSGDVSINEDLDIGGSIESVTNIRGTGDLSMNTITMTGFNVDADGVVGIATTVDTNYKLKVDGSSNITGVLKLGTIDNLQNYVQDISADLDNLSQNQLVDTNNSDTTLTLLDNSMSFAVGGTERLNVSSSSMYVGSTTIQVGPDSNRALYENDGITVRDHLQIYCDNSNINQSYIDTNDGPLYFTTNNKADMNMVIYSGGDVSFANDVYMDGSLNVGTNIHGTGDLSINTITMTGFSVDADGDVVTKSIDNTSGGITNAGAISGVTTLTTTGNVILGSDSVDTVTINGKIQGTTTFDNGATIVNTDANTLTINEATTSFSGAITTTGNATVGGDLTVNGNDITFDNGATIVNTNASTLTITETTTAFSGAVTTTGNATVGGDLTVTGNDINFGNGATIVNTDADTLTITEDTTVFSGDLNVNGQTKIYDTNGRHLRFGNGSSNMQHMDFYNSSSSSNPFYLNFYSGEDIRFFAPANNNVFTVYGHTEISGNLNIGMADSNPESSSYKLDVSGDINFTGNLYQNDSLFSSGGGAFEEDTTQTYAYYNGKIHIGNTSSPTYQLEVNGTVEANNFIATSDERKKKNIQALESPLEKIMKLQGRNYTWNDSCADGLVGKKSSGFIAQEVEKIIPEVVMTRPPVDKDILEKNKDTTEDGDCDDDKKEIPELKGIDYNGLVPYLVECIKELKTELDINREELKTTREILKANNMELYENKREISALNEKLQKSHIIKMK